MALIGSDNNLGDNFLTCCKCMVLFDNETHAPKLLRCLHTYCKQCLKIRTSETSIVTCEICKTVDTVTPENLPNNTLVTECLQKLKRPQTEVFCGNCLKTAVAFCEDWDMNVCKTCIDKHRLQNISKLQEVQKLQDNLEMNAMIRANQITDNCWHNSKRSKMLNMFRSNRRKKTCSKCRRGVSRKRLTSRTLTPRKRRCNSTSSYTLDLASNATCKNKLTELLLQQCQERTQSIQNALPAIARSIDEVDNDCREKEDDIDDLFRSLSNKLEQQRGIAKQRVRQLCEAKKGVLRDQKSKMESLYAESKGVSQFAEHLSKYSEPGQHLELQQQVNDRLKELAERGNSQIENVTKSTKPGFREMADPSSSSMHPFCYAEPLEIMHRTADSDYDSGFTL